MNNLEGRIDTHHHIMPEFWRQASMADTPGGGFEAPRWSAEAALSMMDATRTRAAILSVSAPGVNFGDNTKARELGRRVNDHTAEVVKNRPDRFGFFASLPLPDVEGSLAETARAFDELDADGVILLANSLGTYVGDPSFDPLMEELDRRSAVVFVHPGALPGPAVKGIPPFLADFLLDTVRAALSMVLHDIPGRFPNLRIILSHGGGFLPYIPARLDHTFSAMGLGHEQTEALKSFWYDTALTPSATSLPSLLGFADHAKITYGSDFPYVEPDTIANFARTLDAWQMDDDLRAAIDHGNAEQLFPRFSVRHEQK